MVSLKKDLLFIAGEIYNIPTRFKFKRKARAPEISERVREIALSDVPIEMLSGRYTCNQCAHKRKKSDKKLECEYEPPKGSPQWLVLYASQEDPRKFAARRDLCAVKVAEIRALHETGKLERYKIEPNGINPEEFPLKSAIKTPEQVDNAVKQYEKTFLQRN